MCNVIGRRGKIEKDNEWQFANWYQLMFNRVPLWQTQLDSSLVSYAMSESQLRWLTSFTFELGTDFGYEHHTVAVRELAWMLPRRKHGHGGSISGTTIQIQALLFIDVSLSPALEMVQRFWPVKLPKSRVVCYLFEKSLSLAPCQGKRQQAMQRSALTAKTWI